MCTQRRCWSSILACRPAGIMGVAPRCVVFGASLLVCLALLTSGLAAHLAVVKTMPADGSRITAPPERVQVWFNQEPSPRISRLEVRGPAGAVPLGPIEVSRDDRSIAAAVPAGLGPGSYEVAWRTAGDDGHVMRGTFTFTLESTE